MNGVCDSLVEAAVDHATEVLKVNQFGAWIRSGDFEDLGEKETASIVYYHHFSGWNVSGY